MSYSSATAGQYSITGTASDSVDAIPSASSPALSVDVVNYRPLTASSTVPLNMLLNGIWGITVTGTGADTLFDKPTYSISNTTIGGVTVSSPSSGAFSSAGSTTANFSLTFTQTSNGTSAISTSSLVSNGLIKPEGIGDTAVGLASTATGTVLNTGTVVGNAARPSPVQSASTSQFTSGTLQAQVAQGTAYANLSLDRPDQSSSATSAPSPPSWQARQQHPHSDCGHDSRTRAATNSRHCNFPPWVLTRGI